MLVAAPKLPAPKVTGEPPKEPKVAELLVPLAETRESPEKGLVGLAASPPAAGEVTAFATPASDVAGNVAVLAAEAKAAKPPVLALPAAEVKREPDPDGEPNSDTPAKGFALESLAPGAEAEELPNSDTPAKGFAVESLAPGAGAGELLNSDTPAKGFAFESLAPGADTDELKRPAGGCGGRSPASCVSAGRLDAILGRKTWAEIA